MNRIILFISIALYFAFLTMSCGSGGSSSTSTVSGNEGWFGTDTGRLNLNFSLTFDETSKDNNSHSYKIRIKDGKMEFKKTYSGFIEQPDEVQTKTLSLKTEKEVMDYLEKMNLDSSMTEKKYTRGIGVATYMTLDIRQPEASLIHIEGKTSNWGMDEQSNDDENNTDTLSLSKEAMEYLDNGQGFVTFIEILIK